MLAADAPWWAGEFGNLPHAAGDTRPAFGPGNKPTGANASNYGQPAYTATKAPDMSAYKNAVFTPPQGAKANDLSGQVPANQMWAQAYNQAAKQYGGNTQAQSWTMPGSFSSQSFDPATFTYGKPKTGTSWDGNLAYQTIDNRPGPVTATTTGMGGTQMPWQDAFAQRDAFTGNLIGRLNQYNGGQLTGAPTFDTKQLLTQANDQLKEGTWFNPFMPTITQTTSPQPTQTSQTYTTSNPDVAAVLNQASPFFSGTRWQNPFGSAANIPPPSLGEQSYTPPQASSKPFASETQWRKMLGGDWVTQKAHDDFYSQGVARGYQYQPSLLGAAQPKPSQSLGTPYALSQRRAIGNA